jgi:integrase/recombinase XerD
MSSFSCLVRFVPGSGQVRYRLGDRLVDRYLEFVAGRSRPNTLRAVAFDLKAFFTVIEKDPLEVAALTASRHTGIREQIGGPDRS